LPLELVELLDVSAPAAPPPCDFGSAVRSDDEEGDEAPLDAEGLLALALGELALEALELDGELVLPELAPLEEPDEPLTPKAASVCRSSLPEAWIPLDCWNSFTAAWVFGPALPSAGPASMPDALSFS
jgi:hypothetical protein